MTNKTVGIIGAGIGGLTAGVLLTKKGFKVEIFEKESLIGGRASSLDMSSFTYESYNKLLSKHNINIPFSEPPLKTLFNKKMLDGYHLDLGYHLIGGGIIDKFNEIISIPKKEVEIFKSRLYEQKNSHYDYFVTGFDKLKMLPKILRLFFASEKTMKKLDATPLTETICIYGKGKMKEVLEVNSRLITTVNNLDLISSGEFLRTQKDMGLKGVRYPKNGLAFFSNKFSDFIIKNGGKIHLNSKVSKINIEDKKATGIKINGKNHFFDIIISNMLVQNIFNYIDEKYFPKEYIKNIKSLEGSGSLCAYYSLINLEPDLVGKTFVFKERNSGLDGNDIVGMIDFMISSPESGVAPSSEHLVQSYVICTPKEAKDKKSLKKLRNILDKNLNKIILDFKSKLKWSFYPAIWHLDGVAKTINNEKPEIITPIENFYLIGDCVKAPGIGFNCAINSARILSEHLEKESD
jgi:hypothetical protein